MKKILFSLAILCSIGAFAQEQARWIRRTALSPDGTKIAFTYKGDIFVVGINGGRATQITSNPAYDTAPVWSPDGSRIAFASDRGGSLDVYVTGAKGGDAKRLTYNISSEVPLAFDGNDSVLYKSHIRHGNKVGYFPSSGFSEVYSVPVVGGRPILFSDITMKELSRAKDGRILYEDYKGYEDPFRKHHTSSVTRDIWLLDHGHYTKLSTFKGEDRNPVWLEPNEDAFVYTSERDGTLNIYQQGLSPNDQPKQLTFFKKNPVRYLSSDKHGNLAFSWNGDLYYMPRGEQPRKLNIQIFADYSQPEVDYSTLFNGATSMAVSPDNTEIAFIARGDVYVTSVEYKTTKRITNTPQQERDVDFSPDGRSLVYSSERNGKWDIFMSSLVRKDDKHFTYAKELKETQLTDSPYPSFQPLFRPDGKEIAFLRDRTAIVVLNLKTKKERLLMDRKYNYSYQDGDQFFQWAPDSKWIVTNYIGVGGWNNSDVAIIKADGSQETHNLTESGYNAREAKFVLGGKAVAFVSDRAGYRSHGSWGAETDIYLMFLDKEAYDKFMLNKEELDLLKDKDKKDKEDKDNKDDADKKEDKKKDKDKNKKEEVKPLKFELKNRDFQTVRLTRTSGHQSDFVMDDKGEKLYYIAKFDNAWNLYEVDLIEKSTKMLLPKIGPAGLTLGKDGKTLFVMTPSGFKKVNGGQSKSIDFAAPFENKPRAERDYIFGHVVQQVKDKFYDKNLHGVDWQAYAQNYRQFLPYINNNYDFAELLSEMLGELNASHTGARYYSMAVKGHDITASLGLFYDKNYRGKGLKVLEVMSGGPLDKAESAVKPGAIITRIDGQEVLPNVPIEKYLNGKVNKRILIVVTTPDGKQVEEYVKPVSQGFESYLLYRRWVEQREAMTAKWSGGRIGYIHIKSMDSSSFRDVYRKLLGKYRHCDAVVIDTRFNGGGWLHEDLAILLSGKLYSRFTPRGRYIGDDPFSQWYKPSAVLMSEGNYSNASGFPWVYRKLGIGKLVGAPVPGTMTAVWWERQIDPTLVFGIPQVTVADLDGTPLENHEIEPDILVYISPEQYLNDADPQLKAAVDELLKETAKKKH